MKRKLIAMLMACCMTLTVLPMTAFAEEADAETVVVPMEELTEAVSVEQTESVPMTDLEEARPIEQPEGEPMMLLTSAEPAADYAAMIGEQGYATLADAVKSAKAGDTILVQKDQELSGVIKIYTNLTLDGQGHTITGRLEVVGCEVTFKNVTVTDASTSPTIFIIGENARLNIEADCTIEHTGENSTIYVADGTLSTSGRIILKDSMQHAIASGGNKSKANIIVNGGTIEAPCGILVGQRGTCVVNGGTINAEEYAILGWSSDIGGEVAPEITINGGQLNAAGTALKVEDGTATVNGGTLSGACGMEVLDDDSVGTIAGGEIKAEVPVKVTAEGGKATISGGTFTHKPADEFFADGKAPVQNQDGSYGVAEAASEQIEAAKKVAEMIEKLPAAENVTLAEANQINEAKAAYDKLEKKELINNELTKKLNDVVAKLAELNAGEADKQAADEVIAKIDALPSWNKITLSDKAKVENARKAYDALTADQKKLVTNYDKLLEAERAISYLETYFTSNITVKNSLHGWVSVDRNYAAKGDEVTITVHPDKGYKLDWLTVKDSFGNKVTIYEDRYHNDVYTFYMPSTSVTVEAGFKSVDHVDFYDVDDRDYYYDAVRWAVDNGITTGVSAYYFEPNRVCTRAEAVTFLWRAAGSPRPLHNNNSFTDVAYNDYYYDAVQWAVEQGIVKGTSETTFSPNAVCNRGQIVTLLWRANGSRYVSNTNPFLDVETSDYFYDAVQWAVWNDITIGVTSSTFAPADACTRGQIVTFLYRSEK